MKLMKERKIHWWRRWRRWISGLEKFEMSESAWDWWEWKKFKSQNLPLWLYHIVGRRQKYSTRGNSRDWTSVASTDERVPSDGCMNLVFSPIPHIDPRERWSYRLKLTDTQCSFWFEWRHELGWISDIFKSEWSYGFCWSSEKFFNLSDGAMTCAEAQRRFCLKVPPTDEVNFYLGELTRDSVGGENFVWNGWIL